MKICGSRVQMGRFQEGKREGVRERKKEERYQDLRF